MKKSEFKIEETSELLEFLYNNLEGSKKEIKSFLTHGNVKVNGKAITKYNYLLKKGYVVNISSSKTNDIDIDILYEDKDIIVINKEAGLLTVSTEKSNNTLYYKVSSYAKINNPNNKIFVIHRLDQDTSGVVMFAKSEKVKLLYQDSWDSLVTKRNYIAVVDGLTNEEGKIESYLTENTFHKVYSTSDKKGKLAITNYKRFKSNNNKTWLEVTIETGRKNQIRVQLSDMGNPIVGDSKYGGSKYKRLCLHANELDVINPLTQKEMKFIAPIPSNLK